jgi:hypothetical protein
MNEPLPRWTLLPGDPPELKRWLARRRGPAPRPAARQPARRDDAPPPPPDEPQEDDR